MKITINHPNDPAYYEKMSVLLDEIIELRKAKAIEYALSVTDVLKLYELWRYENAVFSSKRRCKELFLILHILQV